jgi:hypothetical protein
VYGLACGFKHSNPDDSYYPAPKKQKIDNPSDQACATSHDRYFGNPHLLHPSPSTGVRAPAEPEVQQPRQLPRSRSQPVPQEWQGQRSLKRRRLRCINTPSVLDMLNDLTKQISNTAVHILNDVHINETERLILSLGLAFIPQQESIPNWDLNDNFTKFQRDVRIKHFFLSNESYDDKRVEGQLHKIVNKQKPLDEKMLGFEPPPASPNVESFLHDVKLNLDNIVLKSNNNSYYHNNNSNYVAKTLKSAIKALYNRNDIVIQEADKKLGTTVMDRREYLRLALGPDQLGDNEKYLPMVYAPR